ncbi:hypothetical protein [uncultured Acetobacteroides sp.]|uniref:hypothetical protein n=1 Tax=uncultured Acetobacteroides sp. TaxID=1760811 RepID=UPI0029F46DDD|nr:hypothetical protein [uncultured Acetobacteroides sp.]
MRYTKLLLAFLFALSLASCSSYKEIRVEKVTNVNLREFSGSTAYVDLTVLVNNPTGSKVNLNKLDIDINRFDNKFAHIESLEKVVVPAKSHIETTIQLKVRIVNILSSGFILLTRKFNPEDYTANGYLKVSAFPFSKKIKFENQKLTSAIKGLDSVLKSSTK